ncbi:CHAT domain-containing protein [Streptomyces sp. NEAU-sy36]|uniref:CHAT domain-containing protein n=1 Tax=unclassified Streptomyces TaxID=2593676 RepID=UPI0015D60638|nr:MULTISPECIES: CHAT domain-containing protein [unclassified Streptomyces]QLJ02668.1 CHAT domain-containing protein [Streptomyces sp. NEAU-sy36]
MAISARAPYAWRCEQCGRPCEEPVWRVVDSRERGDVLESPDGPDGFGYGLCWVDCPGCGTRAHIEAPVLVLRAGAVVPALFATSVAELQRDATASAAALVEEARLAGAFARGAFGGNVVGLPRRLLPFALSRDVERDLADPEAACGELTPYGPPTVENYRIFLRNVAEELADNGAGKLLYAVTVTMPDRLAELVRTQPRLTDGTQVRDAGAAELRRVAGTPLEAPLRLRQRLLEDLCGGRVPVEEAVERYAASLAAFGQGLRERLHTLYDRARGEQGAKAVPLVREALELAGQLGETDMETELAAHLGALLVGTLHTAHPADPAEAMRVLQLALDRLPEGSLPWAEIATNLASLQQFRADGDRVERWEYAHELLARAEAAVDRRTHRELWARVRTNHGLLLGQRPGGGRDDLTLGIEHLRAALGEHSPRRNRVDWSFNLINLGVLLFRRGGPGDLREAERCYRSALGRLRPDDDPVLWSQLQCNLADLLLSPERDTADPHGAHAAASAVVAFAAAHPGLLDTSRAAWLLARTADLLDAPGSAERARLRRTVLCAVPPRVSPSLHLSIAREAISALADAGDWAGAADVAADMLVAVHALYDAQVTAAARRGVLLMTRGTARQAAFLLARAGRPNRAVEAIERGLARELSVAAGRDTVDLEALQRVDPRAARRYEEARERYRVVAAAVAGTSVGPGHAGDGPEVTGTGSHSGSVASVQAQAAAERGVRAAVDEIRAIPGFEGFLRTTEVADVVRAAGGMPLAYLVNSPWGSCVLLVPRDHEEGVRAVLVPEVTSATIAKLLTLDPDAPAEGLFLVQQAGALRRRRELPLAVDRLRALAPLLRPLAGLLAEDPGHEAVVVPTGLLGHVPLHSVPVGPDNELLDDIGTLTLAPSAGAYAAARAAAARPAPSVPCLVAVSDPDGSLPGARSELAEIRTLFEPTGQTVAAVGAEATVGWLLEHLAEASYLHLSCHGTAELVGRGGSLVLADGVLDMEALVRCRLPSCRLVVAGACQTGRYEVVDAPDEFTGLPGGFLQAGAACAITSLWQVNDLATALLMTRLYELLAPGADGEEPVSALRRARTWLRRLTWDGLDRYTETHPHLRASTGQYARPGHAPDECPFASPVHWAAFTAWGV